MMGKPDSARKGNLVAAFGMAVAVGGTCVLGKDGFQWIGNLGWILAAILLGTFVGTLMAKRVQMTAMPEMVSLFNGMGGLCAALISVIEWKAAVTHGHPMPLGHYLSIIAGLVIGIVSFTGSMIAWGKLNGSVGDFRFPGQQFINAILLVGVVAASAMNYPEGGAAPEMISPWFYATMLVSAVYGLFFVFPIGGADMPVVISLLNSFTGVAAACGGFLYHNNVMLMGGVLVGSAGTILTVVMCKAMNRSLTNVLIGLVGSSSGGAGKSVSGSVREVQATDVAIMMKYAQKVIIVPGYGLAVAQAQHICHELESLLEAEGVTVKYAIHPVAGRMPGHMNVLLAESNVSYDKLVEMEHINPEFATTDAVLVVGANDVVNPAAKTDPSSPIYGMPILDVDQSKQVIVLKRSMKSGYAGIENELFFNSKCGMLFGDAKESLQKLVNELKTV
jgi:NAD(P) transhydrogenase subunit beta